MRKKSAVSTKTASSVVVARAGKTIEAQQAKKKVVFDMPRPLYEEAAAVQVELHLKDTSAFMRQAVEEYLAHLKRVKLERDLEDGHLANAELLDEVHSEFVHADAE